MSDDYDNFLLDQIERAKPFIDAGPRIELRNTWPASSLIRLCYCCLATTDEPDRKEMARDAVRRFLNCARENYRNGFWPDPFLTPPVKMPSRALSHG
jgi:hypothetical protein